MASFSVEKNLKRFLHAAYLVNLVGTQAGFIMGVFNGGNKTVLNALSGLHIARVALQKAQIFRALSLILGLVRFSPRKGHPTISLFQFVVRRILFGKAYCLPPTLPFDALATIGLKHGPWKRQLLEIESHEMLGDIYTAIRPFSSTDWSLAVPLVFVSDVEMVKKIMTDKQVYGFRGHTGFNSMVGDGLLGLETSEKWAKHRRIISKYLSEKHLKGYATIVQHQLDVFISKWNAAADEERDVNCYYDLSMLTLDVIMHIGTGEHNEHTSMQLVADEDNVMAHELDWALQDIIVRTAVPVYDWLPSPKFNLLLKHMDELFDKLVKRAIEMPEHERPEVSILHGLLSAKNEDGTPALSEHEIRDEFKTIRGAGHETTGNTLCFMIKLLQENPDKLAKIKEEVDRVVQGPTPTYDEVKQLKYCHQVMYEALRMYPTVPQFPRLAACDTKLGDYDIPKGSIVFVAQHSINYNPEIWPEPEKFIPERFDELPDLQPTKPVGVPGRKEFEYAFLPFGAAHRTCVGQRLALLEGVQIIGAIIKNFDFKLTIPSEDLEVLADVTLGAKHGMPLKVSRRANVTA